MISLVFSCALLAAAPAAPTTPALPPPDRDIVVEAGKYDRKDVVVRAELPVDYARRNLGLVDEAGKRLPLQVDDKGRAAFVLVSLKAGARTRFRVVEDKKPAPAAAKAGVTVDKNIPTVLRVRVGGKPVLDFVGTPKPPRPDVSGTIARGGFIHPVLTPSGEVVTDAYPPDQVRHLGIWSFWKAAKVGNNSMDFWERPGETGRLWMESMGADWDGPVHGGFEARQVYTAVKMSGLTLIHEVLRVSVYAGSPRSRAYRLFDVESQQSATNQVVVEIPKGTGGGVAFRGRKFWLEGSGLKLLTSEGPDAQRARWSYMGGTGQGKVSGIAILSHPANVDAPQTLINGDGDKVPKAPVMYFSAVQERALKIEPMKPLVARYRFVALDGAPDPKELERLWRDFAFPPSTTVLTREAPAPKGTQQAKQP